MQGNFFADHSNNSSDGDNTYDIGFDYTFLVALHPSMRQDWAASWYRLLRPQGGLLITLIFPVDPTLDVNEGPPFPVTPDVYQELLLPVGFALKRLEQVPEELSHPKRKGKEWMAVWET